MEISTPVYVNPLSDSGFKAIFCDPAKNKCDLIALLNVFLRPAGRQVEDLEYATTELPGVSLSNKASRVDLRCTDETGRRFIVEVQRGAQPRFFRRCVYYASRIYALGSERLGSERGDGERYEILPVYLVALTDRDFGFARDGREWAGRYTSVYTFREKSTGQEEDETISIIFVELNRFGKGIRGVRERRGALVLDAEEHVGDGAGSGSRGCHAGVAAGAGAPAGVGADSGVQPREEDEIRRGHDNGKRLSEHTRHGEGAGTCGRRGQRN